MNSNKNGRLNTGRISRTLRIAPSTRAIRAALSISVTMLALSGSGLALADTCTTDAATNTVSCDGDFTNLSGGSFAPVADMTLILGDTAPTSVTPAAGVIGVDASWGGNVGVVSHAAITTAGADGIHQYGSTSATLSNDGTITTNVTAGGANAVDISAYGDVSVVNNGPVSAYGTGAYDVTTVSAYSIHGKVTVDNQAAGTISAAAQDGYAVAVSASGFGTTSVGNEGTMTASSVNGVAVGAIAQAYKGDASVTNSGHITATSTNYQAVGVLASSNYGDAIVNNSGSITATGGQDQTIGIEAFGQTASTVNNTGSVTVTSGTGTATGILTQAIQGNATVNNSSSVTVTSGYDAVGLSGIAINGDASATNSGSMQVIGHGGLTSLIEAYSAKGNATASNSGFVISGSYGGSAVGVSASSANGNATVSNTSGGYLRVVIPGTSASSADYATGISATTSNGDASGSNAGTMTAYSKLGTTIGIDIFATGGDAMATNTGTINAVNKLFANVRGIQAISSTGAVTATNSGQIVAASGEVFNYPVLFTTVDGIGAQSYNGTSVANSGYIRAIGPWFVNGIEGISLYGNTIVTNAASGKILVTGLAAAGIQAFAGYGPFEAIVDNAGSIEVIQEDDCHCSGINPYATGIYASSNFAGGVAVTNSGSIAINTQHGGAGIRAHTYNDDATVDNTGSITLATTGYNASNFGIHSNSKYGNVATVNSGDITITTGAIANVYHPVNYVTGIYGETGRHHDVGFGVGYFGAGNTSITNTGNIDILGAISGFGIRAFSQYGSDLVSNSGHITLDNAVGGWGIDTETNGFPCSATCTTPISGNAVATVDNSGTIQVTAPFDARGIVARTSGNSGAAITNSGDIEVAAQGEYAYAVFVRNYTFTDTRDLTVDNSGFISAVNHAGTNYAGFRGAQADGVRVFSYANHTIVNNSGAISADVGESSAAAGSAIGILAKNGYASHFGDISIANSGSIAANAVSSSATTSFHSYYARGAFAGGIVGAATYGNVSIGNSGSISANAKGAYYAGAGVTTADAISVTSKTGDSTPSNLNLGDITLKNNSTGVIKASADSTSGTGSANATGMSGLVSVGSYGGSLVSTGFGIAINNAGYVSATALIDPAAQGAATATGISAVNGSAHGFVNLANSGTALAFATTTGAATAIGVLATGYSASLMLGTGSYVGATATGTSGAATGLSVSGNSVTASNAGTIKSTFVGAGGMSYGAAFTSAGDVSFTNSGQIFAKNVGDAVGMQLNSASKTTLINSGLISAVSSAGNSIAVRTGASSDTIQNTGTINGALVLDAGNDTLTNSVGGVWNALGTSTDFGDGDDAVSNAGTIHLNNSGITLGSFDTAGNTFTNSGTVTAIGANTIDMGANNPNPFTNSGTVEFRNGTPGNTLTLTGNWAGSGQIGLDVDPQHGTSDMLHIVGNVAGGSATKVNVDLLNLPTTATSSVPVVTVTGDSTAGSFVLGDVHFDTAKSFLVVQAVDLTSSIDASNAKPDVFSVGVAVTGVTDSGALAASIVPGVQSLMNSEVGTWRQRMGVLMPTKQGSVGLWTRAFDDSGTVNPGHVAGNFGQNGNFSFDQTNSGEEIGADFAINPNFSAGLMLGKAQADQHLDGAGVGRNRISGDTRGAYATWMAAGGFYLDASYRSMSFDARLDSQAGESKTTGRADAFNVEFGQSWAFGDGFKLVPQIQYTHTSVNKADTLTGAMAGFTPQSGDSSRGRAGVTLSKDIMASSNTVWTPYVTASAVREFDGKNDFMIDNTFSGTTDTKGTSALVEGGLSVKTGKLEVFGGVNWQDGGALKSFAGGQVGLHYNW